MTLVIQKLLVRLSESFKSELKKEQCSLPLITFIENETIV